MDEGEPTVDLRELKLLGHRATQHSCQEGTSLVSDPSAQEALPHWKCPALGLLPASLPLKPDKQGEGTLCVQKQLEKVSLALPVLPGGQSTQGKTNSTQRNFSMLCKRLHLHQGTLQQIADK